MTTRGNAKQKSAKLNTGRVVTSTRRDRGATPTKSRPHIASSGMRTRAQQKNVRQDAIESDDGSGGSSSGNTTHEESEGDDVETNGDSESTDGIATVQHAVRTNAQSRNTKRRTSDARNPKRAAKRVTSATRRQSGGKSGSRALAAGSTRRGNAVRRGITPPQVRRVAPLRSRATESTDDDDSDATADESSEPQDSADEEQLRSSSQRGKSSGNNVQKRPAKQAAATAAKSRHATATAAPTRRGSTPKAAGPRGGRVHDAAGHHKKSPAAPTRRQSQQPTFMWTGCPPSAQHQNILANRKWRMRDDLSAIVDGTVDFVVAESVKRTAKFLCAVCRAVPIVHPDFVDSCGALGKIEPPDDWLLEDSEGEKKFEFDLKVAMADAQKRQVLKGRSVYVSKSITRPPADEMKVLLAAAGAKQLTSAAEALKISKSVNGAGEDCEVLIIGDAKDAKQFCPKGGRVFSVDLLLDALLTQHLQCQKHELN